MHDVPNKKKRPSPFDDQAPCAEAPAPKKKKKKTKAKKKRQKPPKKAKKLVPGGAKGPLDSFFLRRFLAKKKQGQGAPRISLRKTIRLLNNEVNFFAACSDGQCEYMWEQFRSEVLIYFVMQCS